MLASIRDKREIVKETDDKLKAFLDRLRQEVRLSRTRGARSRHAQPEGPSALRIRSVKSTQKITTAMKMVAAAKLRRAQEQAEAARPYAERMDKRARRRWPQRFGRHRRPPLLAGTGSDQVHLRGRRHLRPRPVRRLQQLDRARGAAHHPRAAGRGQDGQDPDASAARAATSCAATSAG